jgi:Predicted transcriptional regulator
MKYRSGSGTRVREMDPYALEMHEGIQYLVGHDYFRGEIRHFRPTRIQWVETTDSKFAPPSRFDAEVYLSRNLQSRSNLQSRNNYLTESEFSSLVDMPPDGSIKCDTEDGTEADSGALSRFLSWCRGLL